MFKQKRGITLIALIITIIVLLILAGVSINTLMGENGIINKTLEAKEKIKDAEVKEKLDLTLIEIEMGRNKEYSDVLSYLGENIVGIYKLEYNKNDDSQKIDCVFKYEDLFCEATISMNNSNSKIDDVKVVNKVSDISQPIFKMLNNDTTEIEIISEIYNQSVVKYKDVVYSINNIDNENSQIVYIELNTINSVKWERVFVDENIIFALDTNDKLWMLNNAESGMCINNLYDEFNEFVVKDAIYQYNYEGRKEILGFIGTNGKLYVFNKYDKNDSRIIICLNDEFPEVFGNIETEEIVTKVNSFGITFTDALLESNYFSCVIRDVEGKLWVISFDWNDSDEFLPTYSVCLNDEFEELNGISFEKMVVNNIYTSDYEYIIQAFPTTLTVVGLDENNKLWKIQYTNWDFENDKIGTSYKFIVKNLSETEGFPLINDIQMTDIYAAAMIDENDILYYYEYAFPYEQVDEIPFEMAVKEFNDGYVLTENGDVYCVYENSEGVIVQNIVDIFEYRILLDNENKIRIRESEYKINNTNFISVSCVRDLFVAVDDENNIVICDGRR